MSRQLAKRFAVIGFGAITFEIRRSLATLGSTDSLAGVLVRPPQVAAARREVADAIPIVDNVEALLDLKTDLVAECAGHSAVADYGQAILGAGLDLLCASTGALADRDLARVLIQQARGQLLIPSGAVAGIDGLLAARTAGLKTVTYTSIKPPAAWKGTPGERFVAARSAERITFFEGSAREAATQYPQNANVGATVALAGIGLERTRVKLVSDPDVAGPVGLIEGAGDFGRFRFEILAYASASNPKTSALTAHSIVMAVMDGMCFSVKRDMLGL